MKRPCLANGLHVYETVGDNRLRTLKGIRLEDSWAETKLVQWVDAS